MDAERVAVVLFVKNEVQDLSSWIAWYVTIGVTTLIVYDDHSNDGTWELLNAASRCFDIRCLQTNKMVGDFNLRQRESYLDAFRRFGSDFDWFGFFDADELLFIDNNQTVSQFLKRFPTAEAIAINWCNYGSSGHVFRPRQPMMQAFVHHTTSKSPINRHVKSFVRPKAYQDDWNNVHYFKVDSALYMDVEGYIVSWSSIPGIIAGEPTWKGAKIMHYQCRSMEHFLDRLRRRPDLLASTEMWTSYDLNEVEDTRCLTYMPQVRRSLAYLQHQQLKDMIRMASWGDIRAGDPGIKVQQKMGFSSSLRQFRFNKSSEQKQTAPVTHKTPMKALDRTAGLIGFIETHFRTRLCLEPNVSFVTHRASVDILQGFAKEVAAWWDPVQNVMMLDLATNEVEIKFDPQLGRVLVFETLQHADGSISFRNNKTRFYACAIPSNAGGGDLMVNRTSICDWERFKFVQPPSDKLTVSFDLLQKLPPTPFTASAVYEWFRSQPEYVVSDLLYPVWCAMTTVEQKKLAELGIVVPVALTF